MKKIFITSLLICAFCQLANSQQIAIPRIEKMPNKPEPYDMRDWKEVALGYDNLVFDLNLTGQYLPLTRLYNGTVNYPDHGSFYQDTYVGAPEPHTRNESVNSFMGIIGATLCGVDKTNHYGHNWVLMCEEFFNHKNGINLYGNNVNARTGNDWWYELIPNILFYQLYDLYPDVGHFEQQYPIVADRWLSCVYALGGNTTPWKLPYMNYRAFNFDTMKPLLGSVPEPEAAGAIGWLLYNAYVKTGVEKYRVGAELCMENFSGLTENPSYELQYLYGTVGAARMNAEMETNYDLNKMLNWCVEVGTLRQWAHTLGWGTVLGKWNGIDANGLTAAISREGNTDFGDYAFVMNTFQQIGVLAPVARYDDRYARALGKYILNTANSCRLFYSKYLPVENQDGAAWSQQYDPESYIAYEAVRQYKDGKSPYATGDALDGKWAATNLSLYSSSPVGYIGAIIEKTNVEAILKIDLLKTDFSHAEAYPTYLYYNPYNEKKQVELNLGSQQYALYDATKNDFITQSATGVYQLEIPADNAIVLVLTPVGGTVTYENERMLINGIVADYISSNMVTNHKPRIKSLSATKELALYNEEIILYCSASDREDNYLRYEWILNGQVVSTTEQTKWKTPAQKGIYEFTCRVKDLKNETAESVIKIEVVDRINTPPAISKLTAVPQRVSLLSDVTLSCQATDADGDALLYEWKDEDGSVLGNTASFTWKAPDETGVFQFFCKVDDQHGGTDESSIKVNVYDPDGSVTGEMVAHYTFNGNVDDSSGYDNNGTAYNLIGAVGVDGNEGSGYYFNGENAYIRIANSASLNSEDAVSVSLWLNADKIENNERYPISFGLWDHRWKISTYGEIVKWTLKTTDAVLDVVTQTPLAANKWYHVVGLYDGVSSTIYLNGKVESSALQSGTIPQSGVDLIIGRAYTTEDGYNFQGKLDDIRIYDYALSDKEIQDLYKEYSGGLSVPDNKMDEKQIRIFPNPVKDKLVVAFTLDKSVSDMRMKILNLQGSVVMNLYSSGTGFETGAHSINTDLTVLPQGTYLLQLVIDNAVYYQKIIKQ